MADMTLLEFLRSLIYNDEARQDFAENPDQALDDAGLGHLSADDVHDALTLMQEDNQEADFSRDYDTGGNEVQIAAPEPVHHGDGDDDGDSAVEYINRYITNNYTDDRDTITDNSVNQQIDTGGGDFDQDIDVDSTVASGDGAVAAGGDIEDSTITSGDGNTVGDGNVDGEGNTVGDGNVDGEGNVVGDGNATVNGDGNTTSFGDGDASSTEIDGNVNVDDGSSFAIGGSSSTDNTDNSVEDSFNDNSDNSQEDVGNDNSEYTDNSDNSTEDSYNDDNDSYENSNNDVDTDIDSDVDHDSNVDIHA
jgi:hypothetical protein